MQLFQFSNTATGDTFGISALEKDGQAWFVANDVCRALDLHRTATRRLDDDEKDVHKTHTPGGVQEIAIINESGLYSLIFSSNKVAAKVFRKWITSTVIPSIRRHGGYINGQEALPAEQQVETLQIIQQEAQRVGLCVAEEKEARHEALKLIGRGRRRKPSRGPRTKPVEDPRNGV